MSVRVLIVDDEPHLAGYLADRLSALWPEANICGTAADGIEALSKIDAEKPDVIFLDILMPGITGFEVAARMTKPSLIVFVTAYNEYAVKAFEEEAVDYLLKPVSDERLEVTIARLKKRIAGNEGRGRMDTLLAGVTRDIGRGREFLRLMRVPSGNEIRLVPVEEILFFKAMNKYTALFTKGEEFLVRTPISDLIRRLDPDKFWKIHRSIIVNVSMIASLGRDGRGRLVLNIKGANESLVVSRPFVHLFKNR